jgi:succinate-acetate transporter protein
MDTVIDEKSRNNLFLMDNTANPAPLGLCAFGMTTILLSIHNSGVTNLSSAIVSMMLMYGGLAQVIVGIMEWKKNNTFGMLTFMSFGLFWITFALILILPVIGFAISPTEVDIGVFLSAWAILIAGLFVCTFKMFMILRMTLASLLIVFILLALANLTGITGLFLFAGFLGVITGVLAMYLGIGAVINDVFGRRILPV